MNDEGAGMRMHPGPFVVAFLPAATELWPARILRIRLQTFVILLEESDAKAIHFDSWGTGTCGCAGRRGCDGRKCGDEERRRRKARLRGGLRLWVRLVELLPPVQGAWQYGVQQHVVLSVRSRSSGKMVVREHGVNPWGKFVLLLVLTSSGVSGAEALDTLLSPSVRMQRERGLMLWIRV